MDRGRSQITIFRFKKIQLQRSYETIPYDRVGPKDGGSYYDSRYDIYHTMSYLYGVRCRCRREDGVEDRHGVGRKKDRVGSSINCAVATGIAGDRRNRSKASIVFPASFFFCQKPARGVKQLIFRLCFRYRTRVRYHTHFYFILFFYPFTSGQNCGQQ